MSLAYKWFVLNLRLRFEAFGPVQIHGLKQLPHLPTVLVVLFRPWSLVASLLIHVFKNQFQNEIKLLWVKVRAPFELHTENEMDQIPKFAISTGI